MDKLADDYNKKINELKGIVLRIKTKKDSVNRSKLGIDAKDIKSALIKSVDKTSPVKLKPRVTNCTLIIDFRGHRRNLPNGRAKSCKEIAKRIVSGLIWNNSPISRLKKALPKTKLHLRNRRKRKRTMIVRRKKIKLWKMKLESPGSICRVNLHLMMSLLMMVVRTRKLEKIGWC